MHAFKLWLKNKIKIRNREANLQHNNIQHKKQSTINK